MFTVSAIQRLRDAENVFKVNYKDFIVNFSHISCRRLSTRQFLMSYCYTEEIWVVFVPSYQLFIISQFDLLFLSKFTESNLPA